MKLFFVVCAMILVQSSYGDSTYKRALDIKKDQYLTSGVVIGGQAGAGFTILDVRRQHSDKLALERVIFDIGDRDGHPLKNRLGYFHVSIERRPNRVVIDLSQISRSVVTEAELIRMFSASPFVKTAEMTMESTDGSAKVVLTTKMPIAAEVFQMPAKNKPSRIVIDLKKASL